MLKALGTGLYLDVAGFQAPAALLRGESGAEFRFPHLPHVAWWVEDVSTGDFAAAIAHEVIACPASPARQARSPASSESIPLALSLSKGIPASPAGRSRRSTSGEGAACPSRDAWRKTATL